MSLSLHQENEVPLGYQDHHSQGDIFRATLDDPDKCIRHWCKFCDCMVHWSAPGFAPGETSTVTSIFHVCHYKAWLWITTPSLSPSPDLNAQGSFHLQVGTPVFMVKWVACQFSTWSLPGENLRCSYETVEGRGTSITATIVFIDPSRTDWHVLVYSHILRVCMPMCCPEVTLRRSSGVTQFFETMSLTGTGLHQLGWLASPFQGSS